MQLDAREDANKMMIQKEVEELVIRVAKRYKRAGFMTSNPAAAPTPVNSS